MIQDTRGDRQPSFTQMDLEMTFADQNVIMQLTEALMRTVFQEVSYLLLVLLLSCPSWYDSQFRPCPNGMYNSLILFMTLV